MDRNHVFSFSGLPPVFPYALTTLPEHPQTLTTRAFSLCCAACHTPNFPTTRSSAYPSDVLHPVSVISCPSYMTLYHIRISVFYVLSEYSPLYYTLISYPNDNLIFLSAALMLYRIPYTNQYPSYSSILYSHVCPLYTTHMSYPFYRLCSDTGCDPHTRITAPDDNFIWHTDILFLNI